jgi:hypothetical protein
MPAIERLCVQHPNENQLSLRPQSGFRLNWFWNSAGRGHNAYVRSPSCTPANKVSHDIETVGNNDAYRRCLLRKTLIRKIR